MDELSFPALQLLEPLRLHCYGKGLGTCTVIKHTVETVKMTVMINNCGPRVRLIIHNSFGSKFHVQLESDAVAYSKHELNPTQALAVCPFREHF